MKKLVSKRAVINLPTLFLITFSLLMVTPAMAQKNKVKRNRDMEQLQRENMSYLKEIDQIIQNYPEFEYSYTIDNGKLKDVTVTGVDNEMDRKHLEVVLFDFKNNKIHMKNQANSMGIFYSVDTEPVYKGGEDALEQQIENNLDYPQDAKDWGVEGTVYVQFVIDEDGKIPFATTTDVLNSHNKEYTKELEQQAVDAVEATSGNWEPGTVDGVKVATLAVVPIKFKEELNPGLAAWIE